MADTVMESSNERLKIHEVAEYTIEEIEVWLRKVTKKPKYKVLWDEVFKRHFETGKSLRLKRGPEQDILDPIQFEIYGLTVNIYTTWDALGVILPCEFPYAPEIGSMTTGGYAFCILTLLGKWANRLKDLLAPVKHGPIVFCVSYADVRAPSASQTEQNGIFVLSTAKALEFPKGEEFTRLTNMLVTERRDQALPSEVFGGDDPFSLQVLPGHKVPQSLALLSSRVRDYAGSCAQKPITEKTCALFRNKWPGATDIPGSQIIQEIGACAETLGFQLMRNLLKPGGQYYSIALAHDTFQHITLSPGYEHSISTSKPLRTKGICNNCFYVSCAYRAKFGITMIDLQMKDIAGTIRPNPISTTQGVRDGDQKVLPGTSKKRECDGSESECRGSTQARARGGFAGLFSNKLSRR